MKLTTRGKYHEHLARERMRVLRKEPAITRGEKREPPAGYVTNVDLATMRVVSSAEAHCHACGYHVCSCAKRESDKIRARVNKFLEDTRGDVARIERDMWRSRAAVGLPPAPVSVQVPPAQWGALEKAMNDATGGLMWILAFGPVSMGDMEGMCVAWNLERRNTGRLKLPAHFVAKWNERFGPVGLGDMRGMCAAWWEFPRCHLCGFIDCHCGGDL